MLAFDRDRLIRHLPLLTGELAVGTSALAAITLTVDEPVYEPIIHAALILALAFSALNIARHRSQSLPGVLVFIGAFFLYAARHYLGPVVLLFFPGEVMAQQDMLLAGLMAWFLIAFACWQANGRNLIFMVVCGLAIFGLMGTVNLNTELLVLFVIFICSAIFCWGYEQFLDMNERMASSGLPRGTAWLEIARGQLSVALLVGILTFALGGVIGGGIYRVTPNLYATMSQRAYGWEGAARAQRLFNSFDASFRIGGGPVHLSDTPVMEVAADRAALWRGAVYDYYDGGRWRRSPGHWVPLQNAPQGGMQVPPETLPENRSTVFNRQRVKLLAQSALFFAAAQPMWLDFERQRREGPSWLGERTPVPAADVFGCLTGGTGNFAGASEYTVVSQEPCTDANQLRQCRDDYANFGPYLQVPSSTVLLLDPLVKRLTTGATTPYDKVIALKSYIEKTCLYSLNARAVPPRADAVDYFLNHSQRGACDLFSSSLTVLTRIAGIPARVATGYATGKYDAEGGYFDVRGTDAHAWTEVFFPGYGWVPFDPQATTNYDDQSLTDLFASGHYAVALREALHSVLIGAIITVLLVLALSALVDPMQLLRQFTRRPPRTPLARLCTEYQSLATLLLRRSGLQPTAGLTPQEVMTAITHSLPRSVRLDRRRLLALSEAFYAARYSADPSYADLARLRNELAAVRRQLRRRRQAISTLPWLLPRS